MKFDWHAVLYRTLIHLSELGEPQTPSMEFAVSFEQVSQRIELSRKFFIELDGSFVGRGFRGDAELPLAWQLDGIVHERNGQVLSLELKGQSFGQPKSLLDPFNQFVEWLETPADEIQVELPKIGRYLSCPEFVRQYICNRGETKIH